jgi:hypothetical protein
MYKTIQQRLFGGVAQFSKRAQHIANQMADPATAVTRKRVSRFAESDPEPKRAALDTDVLSAAAARAAELARKVASEVR